MKKAGISPTREQDFPSWYQQVIQNAELAENAPVKGCMVLRPYGYAIWENIQKIFDLRLKKIGVQNAYFPLLIPVDFLSKEAEHIEGFAKECAVVTHSRLKKDDKGNLVPDGELSSPYVIRPTSETMIGHVVSKWIQTYRDLPLKINQWCNVMRWEMRTRLFLRTSEFLWQEGHTIFETEAEAHDDAMKILSLYHQLIVGDLAMPGAKGEKTEDEKFPGAYNTYTIEVVMQDGKILQAATSHYLGQTFSKAFEIKYLGKDGKEHTTYTSSWGISTRVIGGIIMSHADDDGLVLPPVVAPYQVVIIPVDHKEKSAEIIEYCLEIRDALDFLGIRVHLDLSDVSSSSKAWKWIKKGAPVRLEVGAKELVQRNLSMFRRDLDKGERLMLPFDSLDRVVSTMDEITDNMRLKARLYSEAKTISVDTLGELRELLAGGFQGAASLNLSEVEQDEFAVIAKEYSLIKSCKLLDLQDGVQKVLVGKSY